MRTWVGRAEYKRCNAASSSHSSNANKNNNNRALGPSSGYHSCTPINSHRKAPGDVPKRPSLFTYFSVHLWVCFCVSSPLSGRQTRGEFSFIIAQEASDEGILTTEDYSAVVWALLLSSTAAPVFFRRVLTKDNDDVDNSHRDRRREKNGEEEMAGGGCTTAVR